MTIFYTSDLHFGHAKIIELCSRPFSSVEEMDEALINNWNETVGSDDTVYVLGDVALGTIKESLPKVGRLNGEKILIPGNHDRPWIGYYKDEKKQDEWVHKYLDAGFSEIHHGFAWTFINGLTIKMSHFPFEGDSHDIERFREYREVRRSEREFIIHGHVHNAWTIRNRQINVGVDAWNYRPVEYETVRKIIAEQSMGEPRKTTGIQEPRE